MKKFKDFYEQLEESVSEGNSFLSLTIVDRSKEYDEITEFLDSEDIAWDVSSRRGKEVDIDIFGTDKQINGIVKKFKGKYISHTKN